ncbi:MAG: PfkB family kinase, nonfunctional [Parcubacteria group bacterium GW2011_GWF2_44_7]|nr:MAG: PfkB family kinase, nonfunctional [Parcubacteria group bacterium GW2011_GWF2_44_7]
MKFFVASLLGMIISSMLDIITFGSATRDIFARSRDFKIINCGDFVNGKGLAVGAGAKVYLEDLIFASGGGGTNAAATFALQGLKTAYAGLVGGDENGEAIIAEMKKLGAGIKFIKKSAQYKTSQSIILSAPDGDRSILVYEGACHQLSEADINWQKIKKARWFYISGLSGAASKVFAPLINFAAEHKIKLAVNPGHDQLTNDLPALKNLLNKIDILLVNQEEACQITGVDYKNEEALFKKFDELVPGIAVMSKGKEGVAVSDGKIIYRAGIPESGYVDRTGSGDAFGSGFASVIVRGGTISEAIQLGTANATATIQQLGAKNGLLKKGEWGQWEKVKVIN